MNKKSRSKTYVDKPQIHDANIQKDQKQPLIINGYEVISHLGNGSYGSVYKVKKDHKFYAIKMLDIEKIKKSAKAKKQLENEILVMKETDNPHVLKCYEDFQTNIYHCIVIEYCNEGNLLEYAIQNKLKESDCLKIFAQLLVGYKAIYEKGFIHRDIKPENIFKRNDIFKIADFGMCVKGKQGYQYGGTRQYMLIYLFYNFLIMLLYILIFLSIFKSNLQHMAPEVLKSQFHDYKYDIWSLGVLLFVILFQKFPFNDDRLQILLEISMKCKPFYEVSKYLNAKENKFISQNTASLFKEIFVPDPAERISFVRLYNMEFIQNLYFQLFSIVFHLIQQIQI